MKTAASKTVSLTPRSRETLEKLSAQTGRTPTSILEAALDKEFGTKDPKSTNVTDPTLQALAQILVPDEIAFLVALAAREKLSITKFTRLALRRDMYGALDCAQGDAADGLNAGCIKEYTKLVPLADRLGWLGLGSFPEN